MKRSGGILVASILRWRRDDSLLPLSTLCNVAANDVRHFRIPLLRTIPYNRYLSSSSASRTRCWMAAALVAVVDDDAAILDLMQDILQEQGYRVLRYQSAAEGVEMLARERPDLLILDLRMEDSYSGLAVLRTMRENPETAGIPCILCSADITFLREQREDLHVLDCEPLEKPFEVEDLVAMTRRLLAPI